METIKSCQMSVSHFVLYYLAIGAHRQHAIGAWEEVHVGDTAIVYALAFPSASRMYQSLEYSRCIEVASIVAGEHIRGIGQHVANLRVACLVESSLCSASLTKSVIPWFTISITSWSLPL